MEDKKCVCPEGRQIIRAYLGKTLDQLREGYLETQCSICGKVYKFDLCDCFTLGTRKEIPTFH